MCLFQNKNWKTPKIPWVIMGYHHFFLSLPSKSHRSLSFITYFPPEKWPFGHRPRYSYPGSLPRALTLAERERVLRVLQPTATFEMLNRMPAERGCPGTWTWGHFWFGKSEMIEMEIKKDRSETIFFWCHCAMCCDFCLFLNGVIWFHPGWWRRKAGKAKNFAGGKWDFGERLEKP